MFKAKLMKAANILSDLADTLEKEDQVESSICKLKESGIIQTDDEESTQRTKFASMSSKELELITQSLLDISGNVPVKSASLGKPVINNPNVSNAGEDRWSGWRSKIMSL